MQSIFPFSVHIHPQVMKVRTQNSTKITLSLREYWDQLHSSKNLGALHHHPMLNLFSKALHHITLLMTKAILQETPQLPALSCPNNVHGVTTMGLQTSFFVHYMKKCVLLSHLTFHAACPIHNCSFPLFSTIYLLSQVSVEVLDRKL